VCTTPALWSLVAEEPSALPNLQVVALGGEPTPASLVQLWGEAVQLFNTYGVTECAVYQTLGRMRSRT
jgi:non-ribosomal peptide synthetase component F